MEYIKIYFISKSYLTCVQDLVIITAVLLIYSVFLASHKLFEARRLALISSGALNIRGSVVKLAVYLLGSVGLSLALLVGVTWLLWSLEVSFLVLLNYTVIV